MLGEGGGLGASFIGSRRPVSSGLFLLEFLTILLLSLGCPEALQAASMAQVKVEVFLTSVLSPLSHHLPPLLLGFGAGAVSFCTVEDPCKLNNARHWSLQCIVRCWEGFCTAGLREKGVRELRFLSLNLD